MNRVRLTDKERKQMQGELRDIRPEPMVLKSGHETICNHIRYLYQTGLAGYQNELCEEIIFLAKKMSKRLAKYKKTYKKEE